MMDAGALAVERETEETMRGGRLAAAICVLSLATFMAVLDTTIINVTVPHIAGAFAAAPDEGTWTITSYAVAEAFTVPLSGWLAARFGAVRVFLLGIAGFALASALCGLSASIQMLVLLRVIQGLCGGPLIPMSQILILKVTPPRHTEMAMGLWMMTTILAPIAGPILGGVLADSVGWRWAFYLNVPISIACALWAWRLFAGRRERVVAQRIDYVGLCLLAVWVSALQVMLDNGERLDWFASPRIVALAGAALAGFVLFVIWEITDKDPVVDLRLFRHRGFAIAAAAMTLTFGAFFASIVLLPLWLQINMGYTATLSGYVLSLQAVLGVLAAPIVAAIMPKVDSRILMSSGLAILAFAIFCRTGFSRDVGFGQMVWPQLAMGLGIPLFFVPLMTISVTAVRAHETASASGIINFLRTLAGAIATAMLVSAWSSDTDATRFALAGRLQRPDALLATLQDSGLSNDQALQSLAGMVESQSLMIATNHMAALLAGVLALTAAGIWLMPRRPSAG
jgi:DHA2 family multidrug resistance protein